MDIEVFPNPEKPAEEVGKTVGNLGFFIEKAKSRIALDI